MIKINLATRKQSGLAGDLKSNRSRGGTLGAINMSGAKDLPIRKVGAPLIVGILASYTVEQYKDDEIKKYDNIITKVTSEVSKIQLEINKVKNYEAIKKVLDEDEATIKTKLETIRKLIADRSNPPKLLMFLSTATPKEVWLSEFKFEGVDILIRGSSLGFSQVSDFMKNLNESTYFQNVDLKNTQQSKEFGMEIATFELKAKWR